MNYSFKLQTSFLLVFTLFFSSFCIISCTTKSDKELQPGQSLGIASTPNLRDIGGYQTSNGATITKGLVYRSNQLYNISENDMLLIANLNLKSDFDLRTASERNSKPDELPAGVNNIWLDVMADSPSAGPANLMELLSDPIKANAELGDGKVEEMFKEAYRQFISLPSAQAAYRELFLSLGDTSKLPALFHCTTGKDRTGWATASLLTFLGVPEEVVLEDYLRSNDYILPMYEDVIQKFIAAGGSPSIPAASLGVKAEYLNAAFEEMKKKYGTIENYFSEALGISETQQTALRNIYLAN